MTVRTMPMTWAKDMDGDVPCARCGKALRGRRLAIHVIQGGASVLHPDDESKYVPNMGDMDFHFIGPECAKKFRGFTVEWVG